MPDPITPLTPEQVKSQEAKAAAESYLHREAVAVDIFANETMGGKMDMTISTRAAIADTQGKWWGRTMSRFLNLFQSDHGAKAAAGDAERAQALEQAEKEDPKL
jgi:hypothetical protein